MNIAGRFGRATRSGIGAVLLAFATNPAPGAAEQAPQRADDFLIVDCLLPGQVRKLGSVTTYVTARRAVRTSASDCGIRGGEFVAFDRADYRTALTVWLPLARDGDPEAMTNVGQIYEKGLGTLPDHAAAAHWYRQAADKGYLRAQINLGYLYETGLGVEKNPQEALRWYRMASGLESEIDLGSVAALATPAVSVPAADPQQLRQLEQEVATLRSETTGLRSELERAREVLKTQVQAPPPAAPDPAIESELAAVKRSLRQRESEGKELDEVLALTRRELQQTQAALTEERAQSSAQSERLQLTEAELQRSQQAIREKVAELSRLETELNAQRAALAARPVEPQVVVKEDPRTREELAAAEKRVQERDAAVADLDRRLATTREQLEAARKQADAEISASRSGLEQRARELTTLESELVARRDELAATEEQNRKLQARVAELEAAAKREQMAAAQQLALADRLVAGPEITLIDPLLPATRGNEPAVLRAATEKRQIVGRLAVPAGLLSLSINEARVDPNDLGVFAHDLALQPGKNRVSILAIDNQGKRNNLDFEFLMATGEARAAPAETDASSRPKIPKIDFGSYHALIIGNNKYQSLTDLRTAVNDATALAKLLEERYGIKPRLLLNATRYDILSALNEMRAKLTKNDNLLIYYAGHGILDDVNNRGHWLPVDAAADNTANWVSTVDVTDILNVMQASRILVISDSCYSGALTRSATPRLGVAKTEAERLNWLRKMATMRARMVLTSGGLEPVLDSGGGEHSVFSNALLDVLAKNGDILDGNSLHQQVAARVAFSAEQMGFEQVPEYSPIRHAGHEAGEFFLVPRSG